MFLARTVNASALARLEEGLEETLTLHRLGVCELGISLDLALPTNQIPSEGL